MTFYVINTNKGTMKKPKQRCLYFSTGVVFFSFVILCDNLSVAILPGLNDTNTFRKGTCSVTQFRCEDGSCIPIHWKCDAYTDCDDGSDEPPDCSQNYQCRSGQFQCPLTRKCIPQEWVCDGDPDCGVSEKFGIDLGDEDSAKCDKGSYCPPNEARCGNMSECRPIRMFCDNRRDCPNGADEWDYCDNKTACSEKNCTVGCRSTSTGPQCFCADGQQPTDNGKCVDLNECLIEGSCDQYCVNTIGSYKCSCMPGYVAKEKNCEAINVPPSEPASLIFSTQADLRRVKLDGTPWNNASVLHVLNTHALEISHRNKTVCYIHNNMTNADLTCANVNNLTERWTLPKPSLFSTLDSIHQIALDWVSENWYFLDDTREIIFLCNGTMKTCMIVLEVELSKPRGMALDPTTGFMFFTKWGHSPPMLERSNLDGSNRTILVKSKIVYPYGVTVDYPVQHIYWVDTYLDFVERVNYDGSNRRTVRKGFPVQNLYSISVLNNDLFVSSWRNESIIRLDKFKSNDKLMVGNITRPFSIHVFHRQRQPNVTHPCQNNNGNCEHICISSWKKSATSLKSVGVAQCMCQPGYQLKSSGKCSPTKQSTFIIYGKGRPAMIKGISLNSKQKKADTQTSIMITDLKRPTALDYDVKTQYIYYSDVQRYIIERQKIDGTHREVVIDKTINSGEGLAIDWMGRNIYWTDEGLSQINVAKLSNVTHRKLLIQGNMFHPRAIVVDPKRGYMYWSDWASSANQSGKIERAWMDGTHRETFIDSQLQWPNGLTIDYVGKKLYWCDAYLDKIERIGLDHRNRETIFSGRPLDHPYGLTYYDNSLYWTEIQNGTVQVLHLQTNKTEVLSIENAPLFEIRIFDNKTQTGSNECTENNNNCTELCLATPNAVVCACSDGFMLTEHNTCVPQTNYTVPSRCPPGYFQCRKNLRCINQRYMCDGDEDCGDGSDEETSVGGVCENVMCRPEQFRCDGTRCITKHWVCDGDYDCQDKSDEAPSLCRNATCSQHQFTCNVSGRCIPLTWTCDSDPDCGENDTSDEHENCTYLECSADEFSCDNKQCIPFEYYCDRDNDCRDGSDEKDCTITCDSNTQFQCSDGRCVQLYNKCDGIRDCTDGSDEKNCSAGTTKGFSPYDKHFLTHMTMCEPHEFRCHDGECIRKEFQCDGTFDCNDRSDEMQCTSINNATRPSPDKSNTKISVDCEHPKRLCDNGTKCISVNQLCDNHPDCKDQSDEGFRCVEQLCDLSIDCSHNCHNAPEGLVCYCPSHLHLQADGKTCLEAHPCDIWGTCSQKCTPKKNRHKCYCNEGYLLAEDGFTCKSLDGTTPLVIFSNRHELRSVDLTTFNVKALISTLKNTIALDFYHSGNVTMVFWTDVIDDKIYRGTLIKHTLSNIEVVVQTGLSTAEGLAVDWIGQNLYWVESNMDQIEVAKLNGSYRRTLVAGDIESPRAIALDPRDGYLFWTDWDASAPRIERCTMAGKNRVIVVEVDKRINGAWPNGLTLDYDSRRIYWIDARSDSIHTTRYDGSDHHEMMRGHETLSHPFAIALFENYVYWTDWRTNSVIRANKWNGSDVSVIQRTLTQPFDIQILHPSRQPRDVVNPCGTNNGNCSHLCLLNGNHTYKCDCPHVMKLESDGKTCVVNERVLLFSRPSEIRGVDLDQPYYHTIPTISLPQVLSPSQLDFVAKTSTLYWTDPQVNEVKKSGLTSGPTQTIIDTGIENPTGLAIDWISNLMFVSSSATAFNQITVCNLAGEFSTVILSGDSLWKIKSLAVDPTRGQLYWSHTTANPNDTNVSGKHIIESASMDGSNRKILYETDVTQNMNGPQSLSIDLDDWRLYWVDLEMSAIQYYDFRMKIVFKVSFKEESTVQPVALVVYQRNLYYANQFDSAIHVADKTTGANDVVLRNGTGNILSLRIYDPKIQIGNNSCAHNKGGCEHLCIPLSSTEHVCRCATGYKTDPSDPMRCKGIEEFVFYSINWEIRGLALDGDNSTQVLGPISRVSMATSIDFHADEDYIYWADSDRGSITRIKRDGTKRQVVIEQYETMDNIPADWLTGLAIDWAAGNMYWSDPKRNVIEVAKLNGSSRYVVVSSGVEKATGICVDPQAGYLIWAGAGRIESARLDGSRRSLLVNVTRSITDITLDYEAKKIYWCSNQIERMNYDGSGREILLNHSLENPFALTLVNNVLYWIDTTHEHGSIKSAPITNLSDFTILQKKAGDSLKDIQVFSKRKQMNTNACAKNNGGCEQLCLFNGTHPVCACPHGKVTSDGERCEAYDSFIMYSRVVRIDSIHMYDETDLNPPYPSIQNKELIRNAIGLAYDYSRKKLFYSDIQKGSINSVYFNGTNNTVIVDRQGSVEGLAFEHVYNNLYWTCNNDATINRINLTEGNVRMEKSAVERVIRLGNNDKPRGIAVDSCEMRLYWTNWNSHQPSIQRAYVSSFQLESIITTDIRMPNALTLDRKARKLYWGDARLDKIERSDYDGSNRFVIAEVTPQHPFDIAIHGDFLFWTDWVLHAVIRIDKYSGEDMIWLRKDVPRPMGIVAIVKEESECAADPCLVVNGGCEDKCTTNAAGNISCKCFDDRELAEDGKRCITKKSNCTKSSFRCINGGCIPFILTCDGIKHCPDGSDENRNYCERRSCQTNQFLCKNRRCITPNLVCNGADECGDYSDEIDCNCTDDWHFRCKDGNCIPSFLVCDGNSDCPDLSDEKNCTIPDCSRENQNMINCKNIPTTCIYKHWICDGDIDCLDGTDEENCTTTTTECPPDHFQCTDGRCIMSSWQCDGENDCLDKDSMGVSSDEKNCEFLCRSDQFKCKSGECIPVSWQCDGMPDCQDGTDESEHCKHNQCESPWEFRCNSTGRCIPWAWVCDGESDCLDHADEQQCEVSTDMIGFVCLSSQFQCLNRQCISKQFYCDGDYDCDDNSDEPESCAGRSNHCLHSEFTCLNSHCIPETWKCNNVDDCGDNSDEDPELCAADETDCKSRNLFECTNGACIPENVLCDGHDDCGDFSDENICNINECKDPKICSHHHCVDKPIGYKCICKPGYKLSSEEANHCEDVNECEERLCSQLCYNEIGSYVCGCTTGYELRPDKHSCKAVSDIQALLIFSNRYYIRELDMLKTVTLLAHNLTNAVALDYNWKDQYIYWSDVTALGSSIKRMKLDKNVSLSNQTHEVLHAATLQNPDGLAVDWVGRNLYWCDKGLDTIEVSTEDGKYRKILINKGLEEPRAIALDPRHGYMYWSDWGSNAHIGKAGMDGSNSHVIISEMLGWPNSLTISYETNELFWADAREDYIAVSDLDGKNIKIIVSRSIDPNIRLHHVFAIAIWEDYIYYTDWETKSVERCHKYNGTDCTTLATTIHRPMDLRVFHPLRQLPVDPNPCANSNCSTLCLLTPEKPYYRCACPENYILDEDGVSCRPNCTSAHFVCVNTFKCIPFWWKCDTQDDCGDGSDEPDWCPKFSCMPGQFQCNNSNCIHPSQLCNGEDNCNDGSDEKDCNEYTCLDTQFKCKGNETVSDRCIFGMLRCDGKSDCPLGDDEKDCPPKTCPSNQFRCANGKCAPQVWVCDHDNDCGDDSDEQNCENRTCTSDQFKCKTGRCIPQSWLCDGDPDCADGEDEDEKCLHPEFSVCNPTYFKCNNSKCIPGRWQCDYDNDCGDNSDEQNCKPRACSESEFRCMSDHKCIRGSHRCDGEYNCLDHSDELDCNTTCASDQFQCKNPNYCIFEAWRCDGDIDCADGSDEMNCTDTCSADKFKCNNGQCIFQSWSCDGENDCDDGSDEDAAMCAEHACEPGRYRCNNHKCIPSRLVCDNMNHCGDHSDETEYACKVVGRCTERLFKCDNGRCINKVLRCDGDDDCGDNSDEKDCHHSPCDWNTCSQICIENKHGNYTCKCAAGYKFLNTTLGHVCVAEDHPASLMVASEADLRFLSPYKADAEESNVPLDKTSMAPSFKLDSIDILWEDKGYTVFWSDRQDKKVQSLKLKGNHDTLSTNRGVREIEAIHTVLTGLSEPRGLAVDWVAKRLYIVDSGPPVPRILVSTLDGASNLTLINTSLVQPRDILVNPALGIMVWSDWGPDPQIEIADLDGSNRKVLVRDDLQWPTGLSMDYPASRLYWADPKEHVIESIGLDGKDRQIVKYFMGAEKPYKLDVFEDTLYVSTWHTNNIMRMDKFNRSSSNYLVQGLLKLSEIRIVQKYKQFNMTNPCIEHPCQETAMCLLSSKNLKRTCKCPEGFISGGDENEVQCTVQNSCSLHCHVGTCELTASGPKCVCPPLFDGPRCQHYVCSNYCRNKGMCYIEYLSVNPSPDSPPPLKCNCHSQWTGERCEIPIHLCDDQCYNGGTCVSPRLGDLGCVCPPGFTGPKCENCVNLICQNGGICSRDVRRNEYCKCQHGYTGPKCEVSDCHNYCKNNGTCNLTPYGPQCVCTSGFTGKKCEMDACRDHCQNGGTCHKSVKQITCECPPLYEGRRCEKDICVTNPHRDGCADRTSPCPHLPCQNGGKCEIIRNDHICRCVDPYAGINCEMYVGHDSPCRNFCENGGICTVLSASSQPRCTCQPGWTGLHCTERRVCADYCLHGGTCEEQDGETLCRCPPEYSGKRCEAKNVDITESQGSTADTDKSNGHVLLGIAIAFGVCIIIFAILAGTYYILRMRKSGKPFMHARLQDNVEISNPMYLNEDIDDEGDDPLERSFTLDSDKGGNFANPVYDSMYNSNDAGNSNEEKAVLLQTGDETVPPENTN